MGSRAWVSSHISSSSSILPHFPPRVFFCLHYYNSEAFGSIKTTTGFYLRVLKTKSSSPSLLFFIIQETKEPGSCDLWKTLRSLAVGSRIERKHSIPRPTGSFFSLLVTVSYIFIYFPRFSAFKCLLTRLVICQNHTVRRCARHAIAQSYLSGA